MIVSLSLNNFGLFDDVSVNFKEGMNVITGESGAGKSMFINALDAFLTGNIPQGLKNSEGSVSAFFTVDEYIKNMFKEIVPVEDEVIISVNFSSKKTLFRINGTIVPKNTVAEFGKYLLEIHSQDSQMLLRDDGYQNEIFHEIMYKNNPQSFAEYSEIYKEYSILKSKLSKIPGDKESIYRKIDVLRYQINEIESVNPYKGEDDEILQKYKALNNLEIIKKNISESLDILKENEENNIDIMFGNVAFMISKLKDFGFSEEENFALTIQDQISQLHNMLEIKLEDLDIDENEVEAVTERLNKIMELKRKYGPGLDEVISNLQTMKEELAEYEEIEKLMKIIHPKIKNLKNILKEESKKIIDENHGYLLEMKKQIESNLFDLGMKFAQIDYYIEQQNEPDEKSSHKINLLLKTAPQNDFEHLSKIASGGEMSRILLALESVLGDTHKIDTMLFDEIDSGVGPRMADLIGEKLLKLSSKKQIIVITHMPQVANMANAHFKIYKTEEKDYIKSNIKELGNAEREKEIKDMYGDIVY
ncbi:MAG: AAA family ATPase [Thermotogae bacterium]|nr:AAA family ATPase [Thermotogota bacterium]